jgi:DNA polymerase III subunit alpha
MGLRIIKSTPPDPVLWNLHSHSRFSVNDAMSHVEQMVDRVVALGQPALGLTDHGGMPGSVALYKAASRAGIKPFPGEEFYLVRDRAAHAAAKTEVERRRNRRFHFCAVAYTSEGYRNMVKLSTLAFRNFHNKPLLDLGDVTEMAEAGLLRGIAATSGCYFGLPIQMLVEGDSSATKAMLSVMDRSFDRFYVELQNHFIDHGDSWSDVLVADAMLEIATEMGLPCVLTQDAHYVMEEDRDEHEALKRLVAFGPDADDAVFPGDGFHLADTAWFLRHHDGRRLAAGREGLRDLLDAHDLSIPALDTYSYNVPFTTADPDADLYTRCFARLEQIRAGDTRMGPRYDDRLLDELDIIKATGMAGYLMLVAQCTDWLWENKIFYGARGSASGSIVCWLLGITQLDPIRWGLDFSRFISRDRTKPPDIDLDIEHVRRKDFIAWLRTQYVVHQIGTWGKYSLYPDDEDVEGDDNQGSLQKAYYSAQARRGNERVKWGEVPHEDKAMLARLSERKLYKGYGTHAAGLVLTTSEEDLLDVVPLMWIASSDTFVTQYDMKDIESLGYLKLDALGLKTLTILHRACDLLGYSYEEGMAFAFVPWGDSKSFTTIGHGDTDGMFQLDGYAARRGCQDLKPTTIKDVIAAMALFRPAAMDSGATASYIRRKHGKETKPARHDIIERHTRDTYGVMIYQEQVIWILRDLGMDPEDLTLFLKAVKSSNDNIAWARATIERFEPQIKAEAMSRGFTEVDWDWLWRAIEGFGDYGFNKAHATAYGIMAYRCAYLMTHHPLEYYAALLYVAVGEGKPKKTKSGVQPPSKEDRYTRSAKRKGIRFLRADINASDVSYDVDPRGRGIRKGLISIKGIGEGVAVPIVERRGDQPYESIKDFCTRMLGTKFSGIKPYLKDGDQGVGNLRMLIEAGAMNSLDGDS